MANDDDELDDERDEEDDEYCSLCQGTGIGQFGDPDTSRCSACHGTGISRERRFADADERGDEAYHRMIDDEMTGTT